MKKIFSLIGLALLICPVSQAQITKQHSFDDQASVMIQQVKLGTPGKKYCLVNVIDSITYEYALYNSDYTAYKTITLNLGPLFATANYRSPDLKISYMADQMFDTDSDIDLLGELSYLDDNDDYYSQVIIFNENGSILFETDIQNTNAWLLGQTIANAPMAASLVTTPAGTRMMLDVFYFNEGLYKYDLYTIPGTLPTTLQNPKSGIEEGGELEAFPSPAAEAVTFRYSLPDGQSNGTIELTDNQGRTVKTLQVHDRQGTIKISISDLENGLYYSRINSRRGLPRTAKMLIER
jgi:hypothetical protein